VKALVPQLLTGGRLILGAGSLMAALEGQLYLAATLVALGAVTDGLDGVAARRLGVSSSFGALFDYFADYLCYVVAPWAMARGLLAPERSWITDTALALPLLTAAVRYSRNGVVTSDPSQLSGGDMPGLGTVYFAFLAVAAVFGDAARLIPNFPVLFVLFIVAFSILMVAPVPFPKLARFRGASTLVLVLLALMPFVATKFLAAAMFVIGLLYPAVASWALSAPKRHARAHQVR
jgi:CDP-diacylglycerol--serine O-phosphatidyltransferase